MNEITKPYREHSRPSFSELSEKEIIALNKAGCGRRGAIDIPLRIMELLPDRLYTVSDIFEDKSKKDRLRSLIKSRQIQHDGWKLNRKSINPRVQAYWGSTLQAGLSDEYWYRSQLSLNILSTYGGLKKKRDRKKYHKILFGEKSFKVRPRLKKWLIAASLFSILGLALSSPFFPDIRRIMLTQGVGPTREALKTTPAVDLRDRYYEAYTDYRSSDFKSANRKLHAILSSEDLNDPLTGSCFYLLGVIQTEQGQHLKGLGNLFQAYDYFKKADSTNNLYITSLLMAKAYIALDYFVEAETWIQEAETIYRNDGTSQIDHPGYLYSIKRRLAVHQENYDQALKFAERAVEIYRDSDDIAGLANSYSSAGFWYAISGDIEKGTMYTLLAHDLVYQMDDKRLRIYNLVNFILLRRLLNEPSTQEIEEVENWSRMFHDSELMLHLELALTLTPKGQKNEHQEQSREKRP